MKRALAISAIGILVLVGTVALGTAAEKPLQLSLITPLQIVPERDGVGAFRLNLIYGRNTYVQGLDLGLINHSTSGLSVGLQIGFVSLEDADFHGLQYGDFNVTKGEFKGMQWGLLNYAKKASGFQLGFVNYAESMYGIQIGLVNVIRQGKFLPFFPIFNFSF